VKRRNNEICSQDVVVFERKLSEKWGKKRAFLPFPQMTSRMHQAGDAHVARPD